MSATRSWCFRVCLLSVTVFGRSSRSLSNSPSLRTFGSSSTCMAASRHLAIRVSEFGAPDVMKVEEVDGWDKLPEKGVVVRVEAFGINPVDTYIRSGNYGALPALPYTPGADAAGVVESVGDQVQKVKVGDRVWLSGVLSGTYSQKTLTTESECHELPDSVSFSQGAAINIAYATAYRALFVRGIGRREKGMSVLVHGGSGGVGVATIQLALDAGMTVFATAGSDEGVALLKELGVKHIYNHKEEGYSKAILADTGNKGVDMVIEMLANVNLETDISLLAKNGAVMVVGNRGTIEINPRGLMAREADVRGVALALASPDQRDETYRALVAGLKSGSLNPVVGEEKKGLLGAVDAHDVILSGKRAGKIVVLPWA